MRCGLRHWVSVGSLLASSSDPLEIIDIWLIWLDTAQIAWWAIKRFNIISQITWFPWILHQLISCLRVSSPIGGYCTTKKQFNLFTNRDDKCQISVISVVFEVLRVRCLRRWLWLLWFWDGEFFRHERGRWLFFRRYFFENHMAATLTAECEPLFSRTRIIWAAVTRGSLVILPPRGLSGWCSGEARRPPRKRAGPRYAIL